VFNKLLGKNKETENIGNSVVEGAYNGTLKQVAYITFVDHNGGISQPIGQKLTIGSEIGELIIDDKSVSARHCTFISNKDVICLIDHSSIAGTFLNKKKLDSGRTFIINANDNIKIGKLKAVLEYLEVPVEEETPDENYVEETELVTEVEDGEEIIGEEILGEDIAESPIVSQEVTGDGTSVTSLMKQLDVSEKERKISENPELVESEEENLAKYFDDNNSLHELEGEFENIDVEEEELDPMVLTKKNEKIIKGEKLPLAKKRRGKTIPVSKNADKDLKKKSLPADPSSNIIFRFFAISIDALCCLLIVNVFHVFLDFQTFYNDGPGVIKEIFISPYDNFLREHVESLLVTVPELGSFITDVLAYEGLPKIASFLFLLVLFRFITTLLFSVSLGQALIGMRTYGNSVYKRLLGGVRELFGALTVPLIIFDLPTFFNKRSFKEVITKTHVYNDSSLVSVVLTLFFIPVLAVMACLSPVFKGLESLPAIPVEEVVTKVKPWQYKNKVFSKLLDIEYDLSGHITTLPSFQINQKNKKRYLNLGILFIDKETGKSFDIKKTKEFSMYSVYKDFVQLNLLSEYFYPVIKGIVNDVSINNDNFKSVDVNKLGLIVESKKVIESIFSFKLGSTYQFVIDNGPIISGHRDFREKIESLVQDKIKKITFSKFGRKEGVLMSHVVGRNDFYSFLPLGSVDGQLYVFSEDVSKPGLKLLTDQVKFGKGEDVKSIDPIAEFAYGFKMDPSFENLELAQVVYERYHSLSQEFLESRNDKAVFKIQRNIRNLIEVLNENKMKNVKLLLNLSELLEALKKRDDEFFNIKRTTTV
jgi:pSer/pThr/pTyr-binding forkhead associated (FHA) protein